MYKYSQMKGLKQSEKKGKMEKKSPDLSLPIDVDLWSGNKPNLGQWLVQGY